MSSRRLSRIILLVVQAFVAITAFAGGTALVLGSLNPESPVAMVPPQEYLEGSPFPSYVVPGLILGLVLGGIHLLAFLVLLRRDRWAFFFASAAGFTALIWIFVQMVVIPFSVLQAVYFVAGLAEVGFVLLALGVLEPTAWEASGAGDGDAAPADPAGERSRA
jgi:hypothetical protein